MSHFKDTYCPVRIHKIASVYVTNPAYIILNPKSMYHKSTICVDSATFKTLSSVDVV